MSRYLRCALYNYYILPVIRLFIRSDLSLSGDPRQESEPLLIRYMYYTPSSRVKNSEGHEDGVRQDVRAGYGAFQNLATLLSVKYLQTGY